MPHWIRANRGFLLFLLGLGLFRTAVADWNPIPSGSMRPTLLEGDVVVVNRLAYDLKLPLSNVVLLPLAAPQRGDVVTFDSPVDGVRLIKRIVGVPGDRVALRDGKLWVNDQPAAYDELQVTVDSPVPGLHVHALQATETVNGRRHRLQQLQLPGVVRQGGPWVLGPDRYFMMGDNRDNSADSRVFGPVPRPLLIGRAHHVLVSADILDGWAPRLARTWSAIE